MLQALDAAAARRWADLSVAALAVDRVALDRINVYPVADGDTGTNLLHTMRAASDAVESSEPDTLGGVLNALARGAMAGARGNSGMLLSQVLRGIAEKLQHAPGVDGGALRDSLVHADELATRAVAEPVKGTLLSVLHDAVCAAEACDSDLLGDVVEQATRASIRALEDTTAQLEALAKAGVVDAGGRGLVIMLDALYAVVHGGQRLAPESPSGGIASTPEDHRSRYSYEVMYLLSDVDTGSVDLLRETLGDVGDCVSVAGDGAGAWAVHVHCDDIGAAIESGIGIGRVHGIRVIRFDDQSKPHHASDHAVLACVPGDALAELFRAEGAQVLPVGARLDTDDLVAAIDATASAHVVLLPNDAQTAEFAEEAASRAVCEGQDVVVVPTASPVQGLAALAVRDASRRRADDAIAMAEAAAATRRGELRIAESEALTWAGRCQPGEVLGLVDGEVVLIAGELVAAARDLADRMLTAGGELVTALVDVRAPDSLADDLTAHLRRTHPEVELTCYPAGELPASVLLGVE